MRKEAAIILAAGQGSRMGSQVINKVTLELNGKPMIVHTTDLLKDLEINPAIIVVGFAKDSVISLFNEGEVVFAEQKERKGTAHAAHIGLRQLPSEVTDVLILQGDDSAFYKKDTIKVLLEEHIVNESAFTFLTINVDNPRGLGRIIRDETGNLMGIVEEKDATEEQRKINEINPACYVADTKFLRKYLNRVKKSTITGEYYLTSLIGLAIKNGERVTTVRGGKLPWRGVNTKDELAEAEIIFQSYNSSQI